ncbi:MAG: cytochrome c oxidase subunit II [Synechococcales cyanobacterium T60_A2020_003]|nr:cytochrome c oxidase subunit II [Synechococcales cyanobacterium T60_A2020_003]
MNRRTIGVLIGLAIADFFLSLWIGQQTYNWMPPQASAESILVDNLFSFMSTIGSFIFFGVMGTLLYSILFQRAAKYDSSDGPPIEGNVKLEVVWTAIPIFLVIWIATFSYQTYEQMSILGPMEHMAMGMPSAQAAPMAEEDEQPPIEVYARQWAWEFYYPDQKVSSTELHLPVNQRAKLLLSSEDVLHGLFVPAFRIKQDVVPGREIAFEFTPIREGRYRLRDSEYSGTYFAANQTNVVVESEDAYQQWLAIAAAQTPAPAENVAYEEFNRTTESAIDLGWDTVKPAPAPIVNYASSEKDPHE